MGWVHTHPPQAGSWAVEHRRDRKRKGHGAVGHRGASEPLEATRPPGERHRRASGGEPPARLCCQGLGDPGDKDRSTAHSETVFPSQLSISCHPGGRQAVNSPNLDPLGSPPQALGGNRGQVGETRRGGCRLRWPPQHPHQALASAGGGGSDRAQDRRAATGPQPRNNSSSGPFPA